MIPRFYHGGHLGDLIGALYSIKMYGGGHIFIGPHDHLNWSETLQRAGVSLCAYQQYIHHAERVELKPDFLTHDFTHTWSDQKEWQSEKTGIGWQFEYDTSISSCSLKKRDFFNLFKYQHTVPEMLRMLDHNGPWITSPKTKAFDVVCHFPGHKICRDPEEWRAIFREMSMVLGLNVAMIGGADIEWWGDDCCPLIHPMDLLEAADYINSAKLFIGVSSAPYHIAEALDQFRFVECHDTKGTEPRNERGWKINDWPLERVMHAVELITNG